MTNHEVDSKIMLALALVGFKTIAECPIDRWQELDKNEQTDFINAAIMQYTIQSRKKIAELRTIPLHEIVIILVREERG